MKKPIQIALAVSVLAFSACRTNDSNDNDPNGSSSPVETGQPNTLYRPAFEGQTRISGVKTSTAYEGRILTSSLQSPWGVTTLPDGRLLITEKAGRIRIVTAAGQVGPSITGVPAVNAGGQGGLLGIRIDPNFATNRMVYWVFSEAVSGGNITSVAKGQLSSDETQLTNVSVIYRASPAYNGTAHYGGRILFDQAGNIVISTGERSDASIRTLAQSPTSSLGKIIRITKEGQPASGNPLIGQARAELYSYGHRNPQGLAIHPVTGDLWQSEHGPRGGDELNRIQPGANYGWPVITYGIEYSGQPVGAGIQQQDGMQQPVYYWDPVISPSGMTFYTGNRITEWQNNLFISSLSGKHIARIVIENDKVVGEERLLAGEGQRFRDITQGSDGALYAITDEGRLYKIDRK